ncbi:MAG: hypothetical protein ACOYMA_19090 [Bacteroidia bacterium]
MIFADFYGMRYAPEDDDRDFNLEEEYTFCNECGCKLYKEDLHETENGTPICFECLNSIIEENK